MSSFSSSLPPGSLEHLSPSRFISFTFPNPLPQETYYSSSLLRVAVLDSPNPNHHQIAAMLVPLGRHHDWIFSTFSGHLHLLLSLSLSLSRLILVGESKPPQSQPHTLSFYRSRSRSRSQPDPEPIARLQRSLLPLLLALSPRSSFDGGIPEIPFLSYEDDDVASISPVELLAGPAAGEMLVEDVEDGTHGGFRRRLRFKRSPNLVQSQVRLIPDESDPTGYRPEAGSLLQPYLGPMLAGLSLWSPHPSSTPPHKALCVGVGGGALLMCLRHTFGFDVLGVEADEVVVAVAKRHFGLVLDESLRLKIGNGIELVENADLPDCFDVIMVDLDSADDVNGIGAPPVEFARKSVLVGARSVLRETGVLVVNVIQTSEGCFYKRLIGAFKEVFSEVYEIDVGNGENYVLVAVVSPAIGVANESQGVFFDKLKQVGVDRYVPYVKRL